MVFPLLHQLQTRQLFPWQAQLLFQLVFQQLILLIRRSIQLVTTYAHQQLIQLVFHQLIIYNICGSLWIEDTVYLDGQGNSNAVFIFQVSDTLISAPGSRIVLLNGADPDNVFWVSGSSSYLGAYSMFTGTLLSFCRVVADPGVMVEGRLFADARYAVALLTSQT